MNSFGREIIIRVGLRWFLNSFVLWLAGVLLPVVTHNNDFRVIVFAGLILSVVNAILKPIVTILALPAILLTLGVFTIFVNGLMVYVTAWIENGFEVDGYLGAVLAGMIVSLLNYVLTTYFEERIFKEHNE